MRDLCLGDWALHLGLAFVPAGMGWLLLPGKELIYSCSFSSRDAAGLHDVACRVDSPLQHQYSTCSVVSAPQPRAPYTSGWLIAQSDENWNEAISKHSFIARCVVAYGSNISLPACSKAGDLKGLDPFVL